MAACEQKGAFLAAGHLCEGGVMRPSMEKKGGFLCVHTLVWHKKPPTKKGGFVKPLMASISVDAPPPMVESPQLGRLATSPLPSGGSPWWGAIDPEKEWMWWECAKR